MWKCTLNTFVNQVFVILHLALSSAYNCKCNCVKGELRDPLLMQPHFSENKYQIQHINALCMTEEGPCWCMFQFKTFYDSIDVLTVPGYRLSRQLARWALSATYTIFGSGELLISAQACWNLNQSSLNAESEYYVIIILIRGWGYRYISGTWHWEG